LRDGFGQRLSGRAAEEMLKLIKSAFSYRGDCQSPL